MQIEIIAVIFDWSAKQQVNLSLFLSNWYCGKLGLTNLPGHDWRVTSDKEIICKSYQSHKIENIDHCSPFLVIFVTTKKFLIVFVRLVLGKEGVDEEIGPWRDIDIRYEFNLKIIFKGLGYK